jgi:uncharacterized protein (TIGR00369 family)
MTAFEPRNPAFAERVRDSFSRQSFMGHIGAELTCVEPGVCDITLPYSEDICQQHGFFHGGVVGAIADNAAGYAAFTLMDAETSILTVEFKLNLLAPGEGERLVSRARVLRPGRTLTVCRSDVFGLSEGVEKHCATALVTLIALPGRADEPEAA